MYSRRLILSLLVFAGLATVPMSAGVIDPEMSLDTSATGSTNVGLSFTFTSSANGGGIEPFINPPYRNASGSDWTSLRVVSDFPFAGNVFSCYGGPFFAHCNVSPDLSGNAALLFYGVGFLVGDPPNDSLIHLYPGIRMTDEFTINLNHPLGNPNGDSGGWLNGGRPVSFVATANAPEPGTAALLALGLLAGVALRRRPR